VADILSRDIPEAAMSSSFMQAAARFAVVAMLLVPPASAPAQTPAADAAVAPAIRLSPEQRQTIYQSVSATQKNNAAPTGFRVAVGAQVPEGVELKPVGVTLATLIPAIQGLETAMVEKQVVLVDAKTKAVLEVVIAPE
jgi:hypothetical protein